MLMPQFITSKHDKLCLSYFEDLVKLAETEIPKFRLSLN